MRKVIILNCVFSGLLIFSILTVVLNINKTINLRNTEFLKLEREISIARENINELNRFLSFKKELGGRVTEIRIEPVNISAVFSSLAEVKKIDNIIASTYSGRGFFFLKDFIITKEEGNRINSCVLKLTLEGSKVIFFVE